MKVKKKLIIYDETFTQEKKKPKRMNYFLPFSLRSSLAEKRKKKNMFTRVKGTNSVKQSMHIITYMLL